MQRLSMLFLNLYFVGHSRIFFIVMCMMVLLTRTVFSANYDWDRLHRCMTPEQLFKTVEDYSENFPCLDCRDHFRSLLQHHPFPLNNVKTPEDVRVWTWFTHNLVNERLDKPWESFDIMLECYEKEQFEPILDDANLPFV